MKAWSHMVLGMLASAAWATVARPAPEPALSPAQGENSAVALGLRAGTLGIGAELTAGVGDYVNLRLLGHLGTFDYSDTYSDVDYNINLEFANAGLVLDIHIPDGGFRISGGIFYNGNDYAGTATPFENQTIGDFSFTPAEIGTLNADVSTDEIAYYVGIGFGNPLGANGHWTVTLDLGVWIFPSAPELDLTADGTASSNPFFQMELQKEEQEIEDDLIQWWPVLSLGISYRF